MQRGLETMIADAQSGKLLDDTLVRDYEYIRHLMNRREIIVNEIMRLNSRHRGPGTPGYVDLDGGRNPSDPASRATAHFSGGKEEGGEARVDH